MQVATRSRAQKYLRRSFILIATLIIVISFFFQGHIFISSDGYMIVTSPDSYSHAIINGTRISIERKNSNPGIYFDMNRYGTEGLVGENMESSLVLAGQGTTFLLTSRRGELELPITQDLLRGNSRIEDSAYLDAVDASRYSRGQINLIYQYFGYYLDENGILLLPNYHRETGVSVFQLVVSLALMVWLGIKCETDNYEVTYWDKYNLRQNLRLLAGILLAFCISVTPLLTIW